MRKKVVLFVDGGVDDAFALWYAVHDPRLQVLGIVGGYGNMPRDLAVRNAKWLLRQAGREEIPVFAGCERPMTGENPTFFPEVHGAQGLGPYELPLTKEQGAELPELMKLLARAGEFVVLELGRMTSLATLTLLYGARWRGVPIYAMGGAFGVGNISEVAEANLHGDPIAAHLVLTSGADVTLFPLNVTQKAILTPEQAAVTPLKPLYDTYYRYYQDKNRALSGAPLHDLLPVFALNREDALQFTRRHVQVETGSGLTRGQTIADFRPSASEVAAPAGTRIAWELDLAVFVHDVVGILKK
ncbi:nucleoside hydrolase [Tumebacillus permanentifrigoris]|uniref:Purine nucleosidase n=1 Tax=Tumebacillus permanentifrigoris TaxID=378543 RepID=A0A316D6L2_9BACL|nr:nucleoside hydrolase [Tumebacillus permanentifrigoris]PWK07860.1 purine nucleosidase [Tumebacillus permanentifrigoris]